MSDLRESIKRYWVLEYVNGRQFLGRFNSHWTRSSAIDVAALWDSQAEAENALQALLQEADERLARKRGNHPSQFWYDIYGGMVIAREVETITRVVDAKPAQEQP